VRHPEPLRTIVDIALSQDKGLWATRGHPHYVFPSRQTHCCASPPARPTRSGPEPRELQADACPPSARHHRQECGPKSREAAPRVQFLNSGITDGNHEQGRGLLRPRYRPGEVGNEFGGGFSVAPLSQPCDLRHRARVAKHGADARLPDARVEKGHDARPSAVGSSRHPRRSTPDALEHFVVEAIMQGNEKFGAIVEVHIERALRMPGGSRHCLH
jgi:hypothetical protein